MLNIFNFINIQENVCDMKICLTEDFITVKLRFINRKCWSGKENKLEFFGVFLSPLASWFAENYHKDYPTLEQTNTTYKEK